MGDWNSCCCVDMALFMELTFNLKMSHAISPRGVERLFHLKFHKKWFITNTVEIIRSIRRKLILGKYSFHKNSRKCHELSIFLAYVISHTSANYNTNYFSRNRLISNLVALFKHTRLSIAFQSCLLHLTSAKVRPH